MAANKFYSYYLRGNKIALVEQDIDDNGIWKSPIATVIDGLEIEYAYSPRYNLGEGYVVNTSKFYVSGWTVALRDDPGNPGKKRGYLAFFRRTDDSVHDWQIGYGVDVSDGEDIVIQGSSRWNGLHKVQGYTTASAFGLLITWTEVNSANYPSFGNSNFATKGVGQIDFHSDNYIHDGGSSHYLADYFSEGDYMWIEGSAADKNNGLFHVSSVSQSSTAASSKVHLDRRYVIVNSADAVTSSTGLNNEYSAAAALVTETDQTDIIVFKAERDFCAVLADVNVLSDEADTIDLPEYLSRALVYYVKAKIAEDQRDIELKEYFMREFRQMVEKQESSKIWGARLVVPASNAIR